MQPVLTLDLFGGTDSDNNARSSAIPYENASKGGKVPDANTGKGVAGFKPQTVNNVMGSVAGSGSGDFHHYRADRAREHYRLKKMDEDWENRIKDQEFAKRVAVNKKKTEDRTRKRAFWPACMQAACTPAPCSCC